MRRTTDEILMRRYFLEDLPQDERVRFENQYLADAEMFEELLATENDLIDAYVRGELAEGERQRFEAEYLKSPERRERVEFARALTQVSALEKQAISTQTASPWKKVWAAFLVPRRVPEWTLAAAAVVLVAGGSWLMVQNQRLRVDLQQALTGQAELRQEEDALRQHIAELERNPKDQARENPPGSEVAKLETPTEVTLSLTPGIARSAGGPQNTLILPPTASSVRLQLMLDRDEYKNYEAMLLTAERQKVFQGKNLRSHSIDGSAVVAWRLPAHSIHPGEYIVQLTGQTAIGNVEEVESYSFRVLRR